MKHINYTNFRNQLSDAMDAVNNDREPLLITRQNSTSAILMSVEDFESYEETFHLMSSPRNAARLMESLEEVENNQAKERALIEE